MEFKVNDTYPTSHHPLRFIFVFIAAIILVLISFWLYKTSPVKNNEQPQALSPEALAMQQAVSALPEHEPVTEAEQKVILESLQKMNVENAKKTDAQVQADVQAKINALPNNNSQTAAQ